MAILDLIAGGAGGGVLGLVGTIAGRFMAFKERKQKNAHDLKLLEFKREDNAHELAVLAQKGETAKALHAMNIERMNADTENEILITQQKGSWDNLANSYAHDSAIGETSRWVNNALRLVRPAITFIMWIIVLIIFLMTKDEEITKSVLFVGTTAAVWWFGDRAPAYKKVTK